MLPAKLLGTTDMHYKAASKPFMADKTSVSCNRPQHQACFVRQSLLAPQPLNDPHHGHHNDYAGATPTTLPIKQCIH